MKKIFLIVISALLILCAGCGAGDVGGESSSSTESQNSQATSSEIKSADQYNNDIKGLTSYMVDCGYVSGEPVVMSADIIGATEGYKYNFKKENSTVSIEFYNYDLENLNEKASDIINDVKADGKFVILGEKINAVMSNNGKYMMIYSQTVAGKDNDNVDEQLVEAFKQFKA